MFDSESLSDAREREGSAAEDRPTGIDEVLAPREKVGYEVEKPLLDMEYQDYPKGDDILLPDAGSTLQTLVNHPRVTSVEDIAKELNTTVGFVKDSADLHHVSLPEGGFDIDVETSRLDSLLDAEWPTGMRDSSNPVTVTILYLKGLSTEEIADVFDDEGERNVRANDIKQTLIDAGVIEGRTTEEKEYRRKQQRGELNRTGNGITIDATDM